MAHRFTAWCCYGPALPFRVVFIRVGLLLAFVVSRMEKSELSPSSEIASQFNSFSHSPRPKGLNKSFALFVPKAFLPGAEIVFVRVAGSQLFPKSFKSSNLFSSGFYKNTDLRLRKWLVIGSLMSIFHLILGSIVSFDTMDSLGIGSERRSGPRFL